VRERLKYILFIKRKSILTIFLEIHMSDSFRTNIWIREANTKDDGLIFKNIN